MTIVEIRAPRWNLNGVDFEPKIDTNAAGRSVVEAAGGDTLFQQTVAPQSGQNVAVTSVMDAPPQSWVPTRPWQVRTQMAPAADGYGGSDVPEPGEMLLAGVGLVAVALIGRRRRAWTAKGTSAE
jgi:hypothetical protein